MKVLKIIVIVVVVIVAIPLIAALFIGKSYTVEREITINKPESEVFEYIKYLKNQDEFSVWASIDPDMEKSYKGTDGTVGFVAGWKSDHEDVGVGEQEITAIKEGERIDYELRFMEPFESTSTAYMTVEPVGDNSTKTVWAFEGKMDYPMNLFLVVMDFETMIGNDLSQGLSNLKEELEE